MFKGHVHTKFFFETSNDWFDWKINYIQYLGGFISFSERKVKYFGDISFNSF